MLRSEITQVLDQELGRRYDLYVDTVQGWSVADAEHDQSLTGVLRQRYSRSNIHLLVPIGNDAVDFTRKHGQELFPQASVVYIAERFGGAPVEPPLLQATGVILEVDAEATLQLALQQNPGTRRVMVVAGSGEDEQAAIISVRNEFRRYEGTLEFQYVTGVTFEELQKRVSQLPPDALLIVLTFYEDSEGDQFIAEGIGPSTSKASARPMYVVFSIGMGTGALGGQVHDLNAVGRTAGKLAARVLMGTRASDIPVQEGTFQRPMFDWQQMKRWGIQEEQLPPGSLIINREFTAWQRYRWWIVAAVGLVLLQGLLITGLTFEWLRKRRAESRLGERLRHEKLVSELAEAFLNLPAELFYDNLQRAFRRVLQRYGLDRIALFEFAEDRQKMTLQAFDLRADAKAPPGEIYIDQIRWIVDRLLDRVPAYARRLSDLPEEARTTREFLQTLGVWSYVIFPIIHEDGVQGALSFSTVGREVDWTPGLLQELHTITDIFSSALERKRAEEELRESEQLKTNIFDSLISQLVVIDRHGKIIAVNKKWRDSWIKNGGPADSPMGVGANYLDICRQGALAGNDDADRALAGTLQVLQGKSASFEMEYRCFSAEEARWFVMVVVPMLEARRGAVIRHREITFAKNAVNLLKESEERFKMVADSAPMMIWMVGPDKQFTYFSRGWIAFTGHPEDQASGDGWAQPMHAEDRPRCVRSFAEAFDARRPFSFEYRLRRFDGTYRWVIDHGVPRTLADDSFAGYIGACIDITELKDSEEARLHLSGLLISAQEQERTSIARELHDHINQRLALLAIETQEFEHSVTGLSPEQLQQIDQLWELTTDISRDVQALSYRLHSSQLRHLGLLPAIRGLCQDFTRAEGIEAECRTSGTPAKLNEDVSLALFRIVQEALRNAQRYSHAQHVTVEVAWTAAAVCVAVTDDGVGFDPAVSGSGLGLISMKERMRLVAGELSVISAHGAGTRVEAHVPLVQGSSVAALPSVPARVERRKRARA